MILLTPRLRLDPLEPADAPAILQLMGDAEVLAHWDRPEIDDPDAVAAVVDQQIEDTQGGLSHCWAIRTLEDGEFVGACDLSNIDTAGHTADIGVMLRREVWGRGYAAEAMRTVIAHAAGQGFRELHGRTYVGKRRLESLLTEIGFKPVGQLRGPVDREGERRDCRLWTLVL
jgi:[ribosomal protein S5]-alanine N-acetyltransferase